VGYVVGCPDVAPEVEGSYAMARQKVNALTPVAVRALIERGEVGRHADGQGLYLHVTGQGAAKWSLRYMLRGRSREMGLGAERGTSLKEARIRAAAARLQVKRGDDPLAAKEAKEAERRASDAARKPLSLPQAPAAHSRRLARLGLDQHGPAMRTDRQRVQARGLVALHVLPVIGIKPVGDLTTSDMLRVLRPIWRTKPETAARVRYRCEAVLAWAKAAGWRSGPNPAVWKENLAPLLGSHGDAARVQHHKAMDWRKVPAFVRMLEGDRASMSALALRWVILTASRTSEALGATWDEIDLNAPGGAVWTIPALRMKMAQSTGCRCLLPRLRC
jgi:hypothetical protein